MSIFYDAFQWILDRFRPAEQVAREKEFFAYTDWISKATKEQLTQASQDVIIKRGVLRADEIRCPAQLSDKSILVFFSKYRSLKFGDEPPPVDSSVLEVVYIEAKPYVLIGNGDDEGLFYGVVANDECSEVFAIYVEQTKSVKEGEIADSAGKSFEVFVLWQEKLCQLLSGDKNQNG